MLARAAYNLSVENLGPTLTLVNDGGVFTLQEPVPAALKSRPILHVRMVEEDVAEARAVEENWKAIDRLIGLADDEGGPTDIAENHDKYLYGSLRPR